MGIPEKTMTVVGSGPVATGNELYRFIPHRPPAVMVDTILEVGDMSISCGLLITPANLFCRGGVMDTSGILEHIAQTVAAHMGYVSLMSGQPVRIGYIGSFDRVDIFRLPICGETITTRLVFLHRSPGASIAQAIVESDGEKICECRLKVFLADET